MSFSKCDHCGKDVLTKSEAVARAMHFRKNWASRMRAYRCPKVKSRWHVGNSYVKPKRRRR